MKHIKLTQDKFALIDDTDYEFIKKYTWCAAFDKKRGTFYAITNRKKNDGIGSRTIRMARLILDAKKGKIVDHINHDTLDNRRSNLRSCIQAENVRNRMIDRRNTSGYKGVSKCSSLTAYYKKPYFQASIRFNRKLISLGYGTDKKKLAKLYNVAAIKYFGEFAHINSGI